MYQKSQADSGTAGALQVEFTTPLLALRALVSSGFAEHADHPQILSSSPTKDRTSSSNGLPQLGYLWNLCMIRRRVP
jgi:hypothetical protein